MAMGPCAREECNGLASPEAGPWCSNSCKTYGAGTRVVAAATEAAVQMFLTTPREERAAKMAELHAGLVDRFVAEGVPLADAERLARGVRIEVEVAADDN